MATNQEIAALAVSLTLDNDNFNKSVTAINKQVKNLDRDFKSAGQGVDNFEKTFDGLSKKLEVTQSKITLMNTKLGQQKKAYQGLEGTLSTQIAKLNSLETTLGKGSDEWKKQAELVQRNSEKLGKLGSDINETKGKIAGLDKTLGGTKNALHDVQAAADKAGDHFQRLKDKVADAGRSMQNAGKNMSDTGRGMATGFGTATLALGAGIGIAVKAAADQETQLAKMETALKGNTEAAKEYVGWANEFGKTTPFEATEVIDASIALKNFNIDAKKYMTPIGDMAAGMGKSLDQAVQAVADAQTGELERLKEFGITKQMLIDKAAEMGKTEAVNAKGQITDQKAINDALFSIMDERFKGGMERQSKTLNGQLSSLKDSSTQILSGIGEALMPVIKQIASFLQTLADKFNGLSPNMKKMIAIGALVAIAITAIATVLGVLMVGIGSAITAFGIITTALGVAGGAAGIFAGAMAIITGPIGLAILAIGLLVGAGVLIYKNWDVIKERAAKLGAAMKAIWVVISKLFVEGWKKVKELTSKALDGIVGFFKKWGSTILIVLGGPLVMIAALIYKNWDAIKAATSKAWNAVKTGVSNAINGIKNGVSNGFNAVKSKATSIMNGVKSAITTVWNGIKTVISNAVGALKSKISSGFSGLKAIMTAPFEAAKKVIDKIIGGIGKAASGIKKAVGGLFSVEGPSFETPVMGASPAMAGMSSASIGISGGGIVDSLKNTMGSLDFSSDKFGGGSAKGFASALSTKADTMMMAKGIQLQNKNLETQNGLLMQMVTMLAKGQQISVNVDGREVAKATSNFMDTALRKTRDSKSRARGGK